jgi:hypothetical protein
LTSSYEAKVTIYNCRNLDMIVRLRRVLIAAQYNPEVPRQPTPEEICAIPLAWPTQWPDCENRAG